MTERKIMVDGLQLSYQGLFSITDFYSVVDKWFREKGYDKYEKKNYEQVLEDHKQIEIEIEPWKKFTDYARCAMKIKFMITNCKDVPVEVDGKQVTMQRGKVVATITTYLDTDYENKWEGKPYFFFIRQIFDYFVWRDQGEKYEQYCAEETQGFYNTMKAYLNLYRYQ